MTDVVTLTVPGTPTPKGRPRFTSSGRAYTDAKTRAAEQNILAVWLTQARGRTAHDGPVIADITATFVPAVSWPKWKREEALAVNWFHTSKPDLDNLMKIIDGLNGVAWVDDSQVFHVGARKQYGSVASTVITLTFLPSPTNPKGTK